MFSTRAGGALLLFALLCGTAAAVDFKPYVRGSFSELRQSHAGRPLVLHFWSATCAPCLAELPDWAKVAQENKTFDLVFVNTDSAADRARASARLEKAGLSQASHYAFADDFVEKLYFEADKSWQGELPFTALVAANGAEETVIGAIDEPPIAAWLKSPPK